VAKAYRKSSSISSSGGANAVVSEIVHLMEANAEQFITDRNLGLIKQIIKSLIKKQISKLTQTYITYSLADIAAQVNLGQQAAVGAQSPPQPAPAQLAERCVFDMVNRTLRTANICMRCK
jgi:hypothetical protein